MTQRLEKAMWLLFTAVFFLLGAAIGYQVHPYFLTFAPVSLVAEETPAYRVETLWCFIIMGGLAGWLLASITFRLSVGLLADLQKIPLEDRIAAAIGLVLGLVVAALISFPVAAISPLGLSFSLILALLLAFIGIVFARSMKEELVYFFPTLRSSRLLSTGLPQHKPKLLDANIIIDGRIYDIYKSGFVEGPVCVPRFILNEVQGIASSDDETRRARGRRGLEMLERLQRDFESSIYIYEGEEPEVIEGEATDSRLVRLAKNLDADIVTNDFSLHKIAELQGVKVLNVNQLAVSLKPVYLPGEQISVMIIREGTEPGQGVGYLDDGTMVVVENARHYVGLEVSARVINWWQTSAGKMLFAEFEEEVRESAPREQITQPDSGSPGGRHRRKIK